MRKEKEKENETNVLPADVAGEDGVADLEVLGGGDSATNVDVSETVGVVGGERGVLDVEGVLGVLGLGSGLGLGLEGGSARG